MERLILPEIVAIGVYNAQLVHKNLKVTKNRKTTMFELELPIADGGISFIDNDSAPIRSDTLICAKPGQIRHTRLPFSCYYIHMIVTEGELCERLMSIPSYVTLRDSTRIREIFTELCDIYTASLLEDKLLIESRVLELIHLLGLYTSSHTHSTKKSNRELIENVIGYIKENLTADLSLSAISRYASLSPIHFHNCFKRATGRTLREFVEEQRIEKAIHLLVTTGLTLTEIAYECGFSSQSYFSYAFKEKMKASPREYARKLIEGYEK